VGELHEEADVTETLEAVIAFERVNVPAVETAKICGVWGLVQDGDICAAQRAVSMAVACKAFSVHHSKAI
jgi:hypothetical protein